MDEEEVLFLNLDQNAKMDSSFSKDLPFQKFYENVSITF